MDFGFTSLKEQKTKKLDEPEYVSSIRAEQVKTIEAEIKELRNKKEPLLMEISKLSKLYFEIREGYDSFKEKQERFVQSKLDEISSKESSSLSKLKTKEDSLVIREDELSAQESFICEFYDYLVNFMQICEAETSLNRLRGVENKRELSTIILNAKDLLDRSNKVKEDEQRVSSLLQDADLKFQLADSLVKYFTTFADKERAFLENLSKSLKSKEIEVIAKENHFKDVIKNIRRKEMELGTRYKLLEKAKRRSGIIKT